MVKLCVADVGQDAGWMLMRVRGRTQADSKDRLLLETRLHRHGNQQGKQIASIDLQNQVYRVISFELWSGGSRSTGSLQFIKRWNVDLDQWIQSGAMQRWYEVDTPRHSRVKTPNNRPACLESAGELRSTATYVCIRIADVQEPSEYENSSLPNQPDTTLSPAAADPSGFQFVIPNRSLARSSKFRAARVGGVVHERCTDVLHDLLPMTLYGRADVGDFHSNNGNKMNEDDVGIAKALVLLQLSCQYTSYCVNQLEWYTSKLERRSCRYMTKTDKLKRRQHLLKERKANLERESQVLSKSIDGMRMLLQELDPETLAQLHDDNPLNPQNVSDTEI